MSINDIQMHKEEFRKIGALLQATKKDLDVALMSNEKYREMLREYEGLKEKHEKILETLDETSKNYQLLLPKFEAVNKHNIELQRDMEILNEFADKL